MGKGIRGNSHAVWFHTAPPTRHGQNHHQSAINLYNALCTMHAGETMHCQPCYNKGIKNGCPCSLCNPRDHCTHSLCQDCYTVELITSNLPTYLHMGITLWLGVVLYALVPETMHGIIVGKRVRTRQLSDRYCTRVWMSGMFWCDQ